MKISLEEILRLWVQAARYLNHKQVPGRSTKTSSIYQSERGRSAPEFGTLSRFQISDETWIRFVGEFKACLIEATVRELTRWQPLIEYVKIRNDHRIPHESYELTNRALLEVQKTDEEERVLASWEIRDVIYYKLRSPRVNRHTTYRSVMHYQARLQRLLDQNEQQEDQIRKTWDLAREGSRKAIKASFALSDYYTRQACKTYREVVKRRDTRELFRRLAAFKTILHDRRQDMDSTTEQLYGLFEDILQAIPPLELSHDMFRLMLHRDIEKRCDQTTSDTVSDIDRDYHRQLSGHHDRFIQAQNRLQLHLSEDQRNDLLYLLNRSANVAGVPMVEIDNYLTALHHRFGQALTA